MKFATILVLLASTAKCVIGHYFFPHLILNDKWTEPFEYVRRITGEFGTDSSLDYPLIDPSSPNVRCGRNASVLQIPVKTAQIRVGDTVGFGVGWKEYQAKIFHSGFGSAWLSRVPDGVGIDKYEGDGDWFKFLQVMGRNEQSVDWDSPEWASLANLKDSGEAKWGLYMTSNYKFTIPKTTPAGKYLLRWEHVYARETESQFYVNCAHVEITNDGTEGTPGPMVKIPGHYVLNQPDVYFFSEKTDPEDIAPPKPDVWTG